MLSLGFHAFITYSCCFYFMEKISCRQYSLVGALQDHHAEVWWLIVLTLIELYTVILMVLICYNNKIPNTMKKTYEVEFRRHQVRASKTLLVGLHRIDLIHVTQYVKYWQEKRPTVDPARSFCWRLFTWAHSNQILAPCQHKVCVYFKPYCLWKHFRHSVISSGE